MTECNRCGNCCDPVTLQIHPDNREIDSDGNKRNWSNEMQEWLMALIYRGSSDDLPMPHYAYWGKPVAYKYLYDCPSFNQETRQCEHPNRPPICRGYPWYSEKVEVRTYLPKTCSFWNDIPQDYWPNHVDPLPVPISIGGRKNA